MKKQLILWLAALFLLSGCKVSGNPLPEGMEEKTVLDAGREVVTMLNDGQWQEIYDQLRTDGQESASPEGIQSYMEERLNKAGAYEKENEAMATGQKLKDTGEEYGTAVLYCRHGKKKVLYRIAFSTEMELMGLEVTVR